MPKRARSHASVRRRNSSYARRRHSAPVRWKQWLLLTAIPALTLGGGGYALSAYMGVERIDEAFCYARDDQHQLAMFFDASHPRENSNQQWRDIAAEMRQAFALSEPNTRILGFTTTRADGGTVIEPAFTICRPPETPLQQEAIGAPAKTPQYLANLTEEARAAFETIVQNTLADLQNESIRALDSPLLEQLQAISRYPGFQGSNRALTVISDGLQNSETARFGMVEGDLPSFEAFAAQGRYEYVRPRSLHGVDVRLLLVESYSLPQPGMDFATWPEVREFWLDYFQANGAADVELVRLRHGADD